MNDQMNSGHCSLVRFVIVVRVMLYLLLFVNFTKCCHRDMNTPLLSSISQSGSRCRVSVKIRAHLLSPISSVIKSGLTGGAASLAPISTPLESGLRERAASQASIRETLKEIDIFKGWALHLTSAVHPYHSLSIAPLAFTLQDWDNLRVDMILEAP